VADKLSLICRGSESKNLSEVFSSPSDLGVRTVSPAGRPKSVKKNFRGKSPTAAALIALLYYYTTFTRSVKPDYVIF
jgi:hypothetical protein